MVLFVWRRSGHTWYIRTTLQGGREKDVHTGSVPAWSGFEGWQDVQLGVSVRGSGPCRHDTLDCPIVIARPWLQARLCLSIPRNPGGWELGKPITLAGQEEPGPGREGATRASPGPHQPRPGEREGDVDWFVGS